MKGRGSLPGADISAHPEEALPDIRTALVLCQEAWQSVDRPRTNENTGLCRHGAGRLDVGELTSGLEPPSCSLQVIIEVLQGCAGGCKSRISRPLSLHSFAPCCTVLRSRWCQASDAGAPVTSVRMPG